MEEEGKSIRTLTSIVILIGIISFIVCLSVFLTGCSQKNQPYRPGVHKKKANKTWQNYKKVKRYRPPHYHF